MHFLVDKVFPAEANTLSFCLSVAGQKGAASQTRFTSKTNKRAQVHRKSYVKYFRAHFLGSKLRFRAAAWLRMVDSSGSQMQIEGEYMKVRSYGRRHPPSLPHT